MSRYALKAAMRLPYPPGRKPMPEAPMPVPSPTGEPVLPQWAVKTAVFVVALAALVQFEVPEGIWQKACRVVVGLGAAYGVVSQGVRK